MTHRNIYFTLPVSAAAVIAVSGGCSGSTAQQEKPNVILIYVDDMGYSDTGTYGGSFAQTPNIDRIGREGIVFRQYYTACPISSPSRVGVTTGMYPTQWGITTFLNTRKANRENESEDFLAPDAPTLARALKREGYSTAHFGKWHMGGGRDVTGEPQITEYGFDEYSSTWESPDPDPLLTAGDWIWSDRDSIKRWERTAYFVDKTLDFLARHKDRPCYINLWPDDMHTPYVPSEEAYLKGEDNNRYWDRQVNFTPVLSELDRQIGRLLDGLDSLGIDDNTIIIFTSDNGPNPSYRNSRTAGLRGQKATLYEGGIRMPFLVRWPEKIKPGQVNDSTVMCSIDLFPTVCSLTGCEAWSGEYRLDGQDMSRAVLGDSTVRRSGPLFWEFGKKAVGKPLPARNAWNTRSPNICMREGDWKLLINYDGTGAELYNMGKDMYESENLAPEYPEITRKMSRDAIAWFNSSYRKYAGSRNGDAGTPDADGIRASGEKVWKGTEILDIRFGDPFILAASDGRYYMYGTGGVRDGFGCYVSDNLKDWEFLGQVYRGNTPESWTKANFWAPEVYERDGRYYMFFSADWKENPSGELENFRIGVAVADSPSGPFRDISDRPVFDPGYPVIDANVFFDNDGKCYLYFSRCCYKHPVESEVSEWARKKGLFDKVEESWVYGVEMKPDFSGIIGEPVLLLRPPVDMDDRQAEWESRSVTSGEVNRRWTEGSFTIKKDGLYYMMYSANFFGGANYAVGYATSASPLGPYTKSPRNPVLEKDTDRGGTVSGVGHSSITVSHDGRQMYCVYHGRTEATGNDRIVFISRMDIRDGEIIFE